MSANFRTSASPREDSVTVSPEDVGTIPLAVLSKGICSIPMDISDHVSEVSEEMEIPSFTARFRMNWTLGTSTSTPCSGGGGKGSRGSGEGGT